MVMLAAWCALRFGEVSELRRSDVDLRREVVRVRRGVVWVDGDFVVGTPKTRAGSRDVSIPPHLLPMLAAHLEAHVGPTADALLFGSASNPERNTQGAVVRAMLRRACVQAGRSDLRFHDLRHTGAVLAAMTGATIKELMARVGHETPTMAMHYQHVAKGRDREIAAALSQLATAFANVVDLESRRKQRPENRVGARKGEPRPSG